MLQLIWSPSIRSKIHFIESRLSVENASWVVSHVYAKQCVSESLLKTYGSIGGPVVRRATDFWCDLLKAQHPEMRILRGAGSVTLAAWFLKNFSDQPWCGRPGMPQRFINDLRALGAFPSHAQGSEILSEFKEKFGNQVDEIFYHTAELSQRFYQTCLELNDVPWFFAPSILNQEPLDLSFDGPLIFDLGTSMTLTERDLIHTLASGRDVRVIVPAANPEELPQRGLWAYRDLGLGVPQISHHHLENHSPTPVQVWKLASQTLEVKHAASQVLQWIKDGIKPDRIAIVSQDKRSMGWLMHQELKFDNLPVNGFRETTLTSFRGIQKLLSQLKVAAGELTPEILQTAFDLPNREIGKLRPVLQPENILDENLRARIQRLMGVHKGNISYDQFESFIYELLNDFPSGLDDDDFWISALSGLKSEAPTVELLMSSWISFLERYWQKKVIGSSKDEAGIRILDYTEADFLDSDYVLFLNVCAQPSMNTVVANLSSEERLFFANLGFEFALQNHLNDDDILARIASSAKELSVFSHAEVSLRGAVQTPCPFWVQMEKIHGIAPLLPLQTSFESVVGNIENSQTMASVLEHKGIDPLIWEGLLPRVQSDGTLPQPVRVQNLIEDLKLSVSNLETYFDCPYKFFSNAVLGLREKDELEEDPRPQDRGYWLHHVLETMARKQMDLSQWTPEMIDTVIEEVAQNQRSVSPETWPIHSKKLKRALARFIELEKSWDHKMSTVKFVEANIEGFMDWDENQNLNLRPPGSLQPENFHSIRFSGKIDRIDVTPGGKALLVDYKTSGTNCRNIKSWAANGQFQLPVYAMAVNNGLLGESYDVLGAQYYSLKPLNRGKGFVRKGQEDLYLKSFENSALRPSSQSWVDDGAYETHLAEIKQKIAGLLEKIRKGLFAPEPKDKSRCGQCQWRNACRAPHLS